VDWWIGGRTYGEPLKCRFPAMIFHFFLIHALNVEAFATLVRFHKVSNYRPYNLHTDVAVIREWCSRKLNFVLHVSWLPNSCTPHFGGDTESSYGSIGFDAFALVFQHKHR